MRLDAGEQTFEAFRIQRGGSLEWARWTSSGYLLDHAQRRDTDSDLYQRVVSAPSFLKPPESPQHDGTLGRPAFRLEMATLSKSGVHALSMSKFPNDIAALADEFRRRIAATPVRPGWYLWTTPYPAVGKADIDLTEASCDTAVEKALAAAVATGDLIVRADDGIQAFMSGEHASRIAFSARTVAGDLRFGVLYAK